MKAGVGSRGWILGALACYALVVAAIVLLPVGYGDITNAIDSWIRFGLGITVFGAGWIEFVANILMFVPLGLLLTLLFRNRWYGIILALALSVLAEVAQAFIPSREPSLRDVLANVVGASIGAVIAFLTVLRKKRGPAETATVEAIDAPPTVTRRVR